MAQQQTLARFFGSKASASKGVKRSKSPSPKPIEKIRKIDDENVTESPNPKSSNPSSPIFNSPSNSTSSNSTSSNSTLSNSTLSNSTLSNSKLISSPPANGILSKLKSERSTVGSNQKSPSLKYSSITSVFEKIEAESGRLKITSIITDFFFDILKETPDKLTKVVYLFINRLGPDYEPDLELGLGETLLIKAISECYGRPIAQIKKDYHDLGDLGMVAQKSRLGQPTMFKPAALDVDTVFDNLTNIAKLTGKDSQLRKIALINRMLTACDMKSSEAKFLVRSLEGKLRIGLAEKTVLTGLAQAFTRYQEWKEDPNKKSATNPDKIAANEEIIREAFSRIPNYAIIIEKSYEYGVANLLDHCQLTPGIPLKPMLAKPTKSISEVLDRFQGEEFTCEYKYDGERAQIHVLFDGSVRIYLRNLEDMSQRYPDLIGTIKDFLRGQENDELEKPNQVKNGSESVNIESESVNIESESVEKETEVSHTLHEIAEKDLSSPLPTKTHVSFILDCEVVAWDPVANKILPFQVLSTRKRKDVNEKDIKVQICVFAFDMLFFNELLITKSLSERRALMKASLKPVEGKFQFATMKNSSNLDELQLFLDQSVKDLCEGLMVKMLNGRESYYEPSKRSRNWLKLKKDYLAGVGDSLDLVVVGAYVGKGKRTGHYGGFLLASYNQDSGEYETTCKIGTGFSDEALAMLHAKLKPTEIPSAKPYVIHDPTVKPDVWFEPTTVFEVLTADLSLSPVYKAAHQQYGKGISLRFPRFLRLRDDKGAEDATSSDQVAEFYERQANLQ